jgi:MOSC domain-containing protein YiiM
VTAARIKSITCQPLGKDYSERRDYYIREAVPQATLLAGHGIAGDQKAGRNPERQLNLLSYEWVQSLAAQGHNSEPGQFGEQMVLAGMAVEELQPGDRLQLGGEAVIEITKARTGCVRLELVQKDVLQRSGGTIGVLAKVVQGGEIAVGDDVKVLQVESV